jgi:CO dehydrogenase maturation factor
MAYTIAVAGKGGTGKTTVSSLIIAYLLSKKNGSILAIDADPNSTLNEALGVKLENTLGDVVADLLENRDDLPTGMDKQRFIEYRFQMCLVEEKGFDLIAMGRPEGPDCYCYVNNLLRDVMDKFSSNYKFIVMDNEAGMEHLSRQTTQNVESLFIISDESVIGVRTADRIHKMIIGLKLKIRDIYLVINRVQEVLPDAVVAEIEKTDMKLLGTIPIDRNIIEFALAGKSIFPLPDNSPSKLAINELMSQVKGLSAYTK